QQVRAASSSFLFYVLVKADGTAEAVMMKKLTDIFNRFLPHRDAVIKNMETEQQTCYRSAFGFRNAMMAGNAVILLITIIGLLGYTSNETARQRKELAIRRINGASLADILKIFIFDLIIVAIPAVLLGLAGARFTADKWMQNFAMKIPLHWGVFTVCSLIIILLAASVAAINYVLTTSRNPAEALRYE
ncbi:MAG: ABC transporter permease, partial [Bacteroidales bacterium]|nr:ABC transporter permease [Bacteroidales bacterium]